MKQKTVDVPLWRADILLVHGGDHLQIDEFVRKYGYDNPKDRTEASVVGRCWRNGSRIIWVKDITNLPALAHEVLHAVFEILHRRGLEPSIDVSEEAYTYTMEHILVEALKPQGWREIR